MLLAFFVVAWAAHGACGTNLVVNGDFEKRAASGRPLGWAVANPWKLEDGKGVAGSRALVWTSNQPQTSVVPRQTVTLERGRVYVIEADIRVKGRLSGPYGKGASVYVEWAGANGKWLGGLYTEEVAGTGDGWLHVSATSASVPTNAASFSLGLGVAKGCTGVVAFDNVRISQWRNPPLQGLYTSAYRNQAMSGDVEFQAALDLTDEDLSVYSGAFSWCDAQGHRHAEPPKDMDGAFARLRVPVMSLPHGTSPISFELKKNGTETVGHKEISFMRVSEPVRAGVTIDGLRRTCVNGHPFFPLGIYGGIRDMAKVRAAGFNTVMLYAAPDVGILDSALTNGLKVISGVNHVYGGNHHAPKGVKTDADADAWLERYVRRLRSHPALLAWYSVDELPLTMLPRLAARRELLARLDPDHPVWVCLNHPQHTRTYLPAYDVSGADPYPIPRHPVSTVADFTRAAVAGAGGARATWMVPQLFNWASYERSDGRVPTREEVRNMSWQCLADGATGLVYFNWADLFKNASNTTFEGRYEDVKSVVSEIAAFEPFLLSDESPREVSGTTAVVRARFFVRGAERRLLVVNASRMKQTAVLSARGMAMQPFELAPLEVVIKAL